MAASAIESPFLGDRYELKGELGRGAFAVVYRAHDRVAAEDVAIKVLRSPSKEAVARFRRELRAARKVTHPGVVRIHDLIEIGDRVALSMELVEGLTLQAKLQIDGALSISSLTSLAVDLARGLAALHRAGVTHRDLKPENIILRASNQRAVIADFGVSRLALGGPVSPLAATIDPASAPAESGTIAGTPLYMAPEQLYGSAEVGPAADVYALGLVLLTAATGAPPNEGVTSLPDLREARLQSPPAVPIEIPSPLRQVIERCLQPDAASRFPDGAAVRAALEPLAPLSPMSIDGRWLRRPRRARSRLLQATAVALVVLGLAAGAIGFWWHLGRPLGCDESYGSDAENRIVLGVAMPAKPDTKQLLQAMRMAVDEINRREGVGYRPFALEICDTAQARARLRSQVSWLQRRAPVIITGGSSETLTASSVASPAGVLVMSPTATSPELRDVPPSHGVRLLWRATPSDQAQGAAMAEVLLHDPVFAQVRKVAVFYPDDLYGQGLAAVLRAQLHGREVVPVQYPLGGDPEPQLAQLDAARPDVTVLVASIGDYEKRLLNLAAEKPHLQSAAGHRWFFSEDAKPDDELLAALEHPDQLDGAYSTEPAHGVGDAYAAFASRFRSRFALEPSSPFAAHSYDTIYLLALAAAWAAGNDGKGAVSGERLALGLAHLSSGKRFPLAPEQFTAAKSELTSSGYLDADGASGALDLDPKSGEPASPITVSQLRGRRFVEVRTIDPAR